MRKSKLAGIFSCLGAVLFAACGGDDATATGGDDAGDASATDASGGDVVTSDATTDGGRDGTTDGTTDAPNDVSSDVLTHDVNTGDAGCVAQPPTGLSLKIVPVNTTSLGTGTFAQQPPGSTDWYFVEQSGKVWLVRNGTKATTPFLDISAAMGSNYGERGLLSIAFHPRYAQNGRFFTMGTPADGADGTYSPINADAVVEWKRDPNNPDKALPTKVRDIVVLPVSDANHNGGTIMFGPDNYLYVGTGDGGGGCESSQPGAVQDTTKLFGKILRLDVDGTAPFAAPGNPFTSDARVYHYGLRNPFRYNFDPLTNDLFIGDVGQSTNEELDVAPGNAPGKNFGWPAYEGTSQGTCGNKPLGGPSPHTPPIVSIDRTSGSTSPFKDYSSIIAGRVYRGAMSPALQGIYFFADFAGAEIGALRYCNGQVYGPVPYPTGQIPTGTGGGTFNQITAFVQGNDGEVYVVYGLYGNSHIGRLATQ